MKSTLAASRAAYYLLAGLLLVLALALASPRPTTAQNGNNSNTTRTDQGNGNGNGNGNGSTGGTTRTDPAEGTATKPDTPKPPCPVPDTAPAPSVSNVHKDKSTTDDRNVELGDVIVVQVQNLKTLLAQAACEKKNIVLYLDGRPLKDVTADPPTDPAQNSMRFTLRRTEASRDVWTYILGEPTWSPRQTKVGIGLEDKYDIGWTATNSAAKESADVMLSVIPHGRFISWLLVLAVLVVGFLILAFKSNLLRDTLSVPVPGQRGPYSLARSQAAWWFFLVLASYVFIGIITGDFGTTITGTVLGLLGISAGTAVGSAMIDANKSTPEARAAEVGAAQKIQTRLAALNTEIATAEATLKANPEDTAAAARIASATSERQELSSQWKKLTNESENFLLDILSDVNGISFHRFQIAAWTLVLGIIFITQVYRVLAMPEFNGSLLALLGISAGTFVGLKIPEATVPKSPDTTTPNK